MSRLCLMTTIISRKQSKKYLKLYEDEKLQVMFITLGSGTASGDMLDYFGLESKEKVVVFTVLEEDKWTVVKKRLRHELQIDAPGEGISYIIPLSSIGGRKTLEFLLVSREFRKEEESALKDTVYELIIVVVNQGYVESAMDAAREAGAYGGTVIHAKGTGMEHAEKFLGVSLATEKEIIYIVTKKEKKNEIMKAIMEKAGTDSKVGAIAFSLPVTDVAGLRLLED